MDTLGFFRVGPYQAQVIVHAAVEPIGEVGADDLGECDGTEVPYVIRIAARAARDRRTRNAVLVHELTHLACSIFGLRLAAQTEEYLADVVGVTIDAAIEAGLLEGPTK